MPTAYTLYSRASKGNPFTTIYNTTKSTKKDVIPNSSSRQLNLPVTTETALKQL